MHIVARQIRKWFAWLVAEVKKFVLFQVQDQPRCEMRFYAECTNVPINAAAARPKVYRMLLTQGALEITVEHPSGHLTLEGARALQYLEEAGLLHRVLENVVSTSYVNEEGEVLLREEVTDATVIKEMHITTVVSTPA